MPLPVGVALVVVTFVRIVIVRWVVYWTTGVAGVITTFVAAALGGNLQPVRDFIENFLSVEAIKQELTERAMTMIVDVASARLGVQLDATDPFSVQSLSNAVGLKIGVTLNNITDRETTLTDMGAYLAGQVNIATGAQFDNFWPLETVGDNIAREAMLGVQNSMNGTPSWVPAYQVNNLLSFVRQHDGVFVNRTDKTDRAALLNRQHQAKYSLTHHRQYGWPWVENE